ncbi:tRNA lysidine(34) synthetase TilS [Paenibacillus sp. HB172176]|uniref:tRNA lysidine(34) synthetase TilS n=1 Tax=Paenibacillus sp. HB172176 TaxID=2493690 RepID=UPI001438DCAD|nr:tRNA lysidine(34) synthetase TilS [Paenibacillus sp. HB172176]
MLEQIAEEAAREKLWDAGDTIVIAVSGGPDSMALLHMLSILARPQRLTLVAAHVNHGFRPEESAAEQAVVRRYTDRLGIHCEIAELDLVTYIEENRLNAQAAAREKRYAFLHETAARHGASRIALAHHADDQAETVLMHLIRGAGLSGLSGMTGRRREKNMELLRPLLRMNKTDLIDYCEEHGVPYCVDSSNLKRHYFRNTIRMEVLPYLEQYNPQFSLSLQRLAEVAGAEDDWLNRQVREKFEHLVLVSGRQYTIRCAELHRLHVALQRRLIKLILSYLSPDTEILSFEGIETMRLAASDDAVSTWRLDVGSGVRCVREYETMHWLKKASNPEDGKAELAVSGSYAYEIQKGDSQLRELPGGWRLQFIWSEQQLPCKPGTRFEACFDADELTYPLMVRNRRRGDRIHVLGLNGSKKVQDMFVDEKIAPSKREFYPLVFDAEDRLIWIPGLRRSSHAPAEKHSRKLLFIMAQGE